jgi:hypothetical protein
MSNEQTSEKMRGVNLLLGVGDVKCDKCGKIIRHLERYCYDTLQCPICGVKVVSLSERDIHFSQKHPAEPSRGTRYCHDCCVKAGLIEE